MSVIPHTKKQSIDVDSQLELAHVTVGAESARRLTKILGRPVEVGETFTFNPHEDHIFSDPRLNADLHPEF